MSALHSTRWHRVAALKPRLSAQTRLRRQHWRGERWMLLSDPVDGRSVRLNAQAYALAGRLDGRHTVQQLWDWQVAQPGDPATQDEVIEMLAQLREAGLLQLDRAADYALLLPHLERIASPRGKRTLLAWRIPLANPSALLDRLQRVARIVFSTPMLVLWLLAVALLVALAVQHGPTLWAHGQQWLATPRFALLAALLYVPVKLLHELAHGLAVRRWGGQVNEAGITLMAGMPVPYVDASAATGFVLRRQRVAVGAAGVMAELALAALALPLWLWLGDGLARDAAFVTLVITGVSTLLFNANPLQRLDGYYVASDLLELPNLGARSRAWWVDQLQRRVLRLDGSEPMGVARGEAGWLAAYAPLSWSYGLFVAALIVGWLGQVSAVLGLAAGMLFGWQLALRPVVQLVRQLRRAALGGAGSARRWRRIVLGGSALALIALALPLPQRLLVQGVVWPADQAQLRAEEDGLVVAVHAGNGARVAAGDLVLEVANPGLTTRLERQRARVDALETELVNALGAGGAAKGDSRAELAAAQAELERLVERVQALSLRAHAAGVLALPSQADLPGQWVQRGRLLGQVLGADAARIRVALVEADAAELQRVDGAATLRLASLPGSLLSATLVRDAIGATLQLPSAALSLRHGGSIVTDPRDPEDLRPMQPVVLLDLQLAARNDAAHDGIGGTVGERVGERIGERAWVRLDAGFAPLALQAARAAQRALASRFNPQI